MLGLANMIEQFLVWLPDTEHVRFWLYSALALISILESLAFVGLLIPGTTVVISAGILAEQGVMDLGDVIWVVALGGIVGDAISFYAGRKGMGLFAEKNRFFKKAYLTQGENFFVRHGDKSVFLARFFGPVRPIVPFVAGLTRMKTGRFFFFNIVSAVVAAAAYAGFGYFFGAVWENVRQVSGEGKIVFLVLVVLIGAIVVGRKQKKLLK